MGLLDILICGTNQGSCILPRIWKHVLGATGAAAVVRLCSWHSRADRLHNHRRHATRPPLDLLQNDIALMIVYSKSNMPCSLEGVSHVVECQHPQLSYGDSWLPVVLVSSSRLLEGTWFGRGVLSGT